MDVSRGLEPVPVSVWPRLEELPAFQVREAEEGGAEQNPAAACRQGPIESYVL